MLGIQRLTKGKQIAALLSVVLVGAGASYGVFRSVTHIDSEHLDFVSRQFSDDLLRIENRGFDLPDAGELNLPQSI